MTWCTHLRTVTDKTSEMTEQTKKQHFFLRGCYNVLANKEADTNVCHSNNRTCEAVQKPDSR